MKLIGDGILLGLVLSIMAGPIFFLLIDTSIKRGFKAAMVFCSGVWISDLVYICIVFCGLTVVKDLPNFNFYTGLIGGILLCLFGIFSFFNKTQINKNTKVATKNYFGDFLKGIAINVFNPFVIFFWIGVVGNLVENEVAIKKSIVYLGALILTVALSDIFKAYLAEKIRNKITAKHLKIMNYLVGVCLIIFGISLIYKVL